MAAAGTAPPQAPVPPAYPAQPWQQPTPVAWQPAPPPPPPAWQPPVAVAPPPPPPPPPPPVVQYAPAQPPPPPPYAQPHPATAWPPPPKSAGLPTWLMGVIFAVVFTGIGAGVIYWMQKPARPTPVEKAGLENPANPSQQKVSNPLQKYVEVVGIRMMTAEKKPVAKFLVVNHSNSEIAGLEANVTLWASTSRSEEDSIGAFSFKVNNLEAYGSHELTAPLKTKLKMYELPDWQNATAEIQITSPQP